MPSRNTYPNIKHRGHNNCKRPNEQLPGNPGFPHIVFQVQANVR